MSEIDKLVREIEMQAYNALDQEITSAHIGELVMDGLRKIDEVSYVRFASVYRQFRDIQTIMEELTRLLDERTKKEELDAKAHHADGAPSA